MDGIHGFNCIYLCQLKADGDNYKWKIFEQLKSALRLN